MLTEGEDRPVGDLDDGHALGEVQGRLERIGKPPLDVVLADQAVDNDFNGVRGIAVELDVLGEVADLTVDAGTAEPLTRQLGKEGLVLAFASTHHRGEYLKPGVLWEF